MKQTVKRIGNLLLAVCMVFAMMPAIASAEPEDSGAPLGASGTITAFDEIADNIRWQNTMEPVFPEMVSGIVEGNSAQIPVAWQTDQDYDKESPIQGLYVFNAVLDEGYTLASGVEAPRITVYIPETADGGMAARMAGSSTDLSPLEITTAAQLAEIAVLVNAGRLESFLFNNANAMVNLVQMNDLDLSAYASADEGKGWMPIGNVDNLFKGNFNGNRKVITGLYINRPNANDVGLFGRMNGGTVKNLHIVDAVITGAYNVGGVAGRVIGGAVQGCSVSGTITGTGTVGGVTGILDGSAKAEACYVNGTVKGNIDNIGGIVGWVYDGTVQNCYATGAVNGQDLLGGVAGNVATGSTVKNCAALNPSISGVQNTGRVAGYADDGQLSDNVAFSSMMVTVNGSAKPIIDSATGVDGETKTATQIKTVSYFQTLFNNDTTWTYATGKLPGFDAAMEMPAHIVDISPGQYFPGEGSSIKPYEISTPEQLAKLAELVNNTATNTAYGGTGVYYKLMNNLDLSDYGVSFNDGKGWIPIGTSEFNFKGYFNGNGKIITGLYIRNTSAASQSVGLFGYVWADPAKPGSGTIQSLGIVDADITGFISVGGVAGTVDYGTVRQCYVTGRVTANHSVGGIAGSLFGTIGKVEDCYVAASVTGTASTGYVGGVVGRTGASNNPTVSRCYALGQVSGTDKVGGVVGYAPYGTVQNCAALNPSVSGTSNVGRVVGSIEATAALFGNYAFSGMTGSTFTKKTATGLDGVDKTAAELKTSNGYPSGLTSGLWNYTAGKLPILFIFATNVQDAALPGHINDTGALFAGGDGSTAEKAYEISTPAQLAKLAELVNERNASYYNKYYKLMNDLDLSSYGKNYDSGKGWIPIGNQVTKPFEGSFDGGGHIIRGLYINRPTANLQGLFGYTTGGTLKNLGVVNANITAASAVGGVVGMLKKTGVVENCYTTGSISGTGDIGGVGGIVGTVEGPLKNCYSASMVHGTQQNIGGVAGVVKGVVENCYSTGTITGTGNVGGVAGSVDTTGTVRNCVAMNPAVNGTSNVGRVVGSSKGVLSKNYAFNVMAITGGDANGKTQDGLDGADFLIDEVSQPTFWTNGLRWDTTGGTSWDGTSIWAITDNKLPILRGFTDGTQSGDGGLYLTERDLANASVTLSQISFTYEGTKKTPTATVTFDGQTLVVDIDYTFSISSSDGDGTSAGTNAGEVTLTFSGKGNFKGTTTKSYTIAKLQAPEITWPTSTAVTYGAKLSDSALSGGSTSLGTFAWGDGDIIPTVNNSGYAVTFTPNDTKNYNWTVASLTRHMPITVNKAVPSFITWPTAVTITYGAKLSTSTLSGGSTEYGSFAWTNGDTIPVVTNSGYSVTFTPADTANYDWTGVPRTNTVSIPVSKASTIGIPQTHEVVKNTAQNYSFDLTRLLPNVSPLTLESVTYEIASVTNTDGILATEPSGTVTSPLMLDVASVDSGKTATITVMVHSGNYNDFNAVITVNSIDKILVTITASAGANGTISPSGAITVTEGESKAFTITADTGYRISSVTVDGVNQGTISTYMFNNVMGNHTINAVFTSNDNGGNDGGGGSYTPPTAPKPNITTDKKPDQPTIASTNLTAAVEKNGVASVTITEAQVKALVDASKKDAQSKGRTADGIGVALNIGFGADGKSVNATSVNVTLDEKVFALLEKEGVKRFDVNTPLVGFSFDQAALQEMKNQSSGIVTLAASPVTKLSDAAKALIGKRPVYDLTVSCQKNGKTAYITSFGKGVVTLGIPYKPASDESIPNLFGVYVDKNGKPQFLNDSGYDNGKVIFGRSSLSTYGIGYIPLAPSFADTANHWAKNSIDFVASRDLISGTSEATFAPNTAITRADFLMALGKLSGADVSGYKASSFTDVKSSDPAMAYIEWAVDNKIVFGYGNGKFGPNDPITREQMAVMMMNYAKATQYSLPVLLQRILFVDYEKISPWARDAVKVIQIAAIMIGGDNNTFNPQGSATRAEASIILQNFVYHVIDKGMARGWIQDDNGQWQYINANGKAVTGWLTVENIKYYFTTDCIMVSSKWLQIDGKWYYFYADGKMAVNTTIDGYTIGADGVRKEE